LNVVQSPVEGLSRLFGAVVKAPVAMFMAGLEACAKAMREMQRLFEQSVDAFGKGVSQEYSANRVIDASAANGISAESINQITPKERIDMLDQDLRGDDLKLVRWAISFTKRDVEVALASGIELVDYSTDVGDFKGSKKDDFLRGLTQNHMPRPDKWQREDYPPRTYVQDNQVIGLPQDDVDKFIRVYVEVLDRYDKAEPTYEKDEAKALKGIRTTLDKWTEKWPG
jgi:hypothetical protein